MGQFASPKQVAFIEKLAAERVGGTLYVKTQCNAWKVDCVEKLSGLAASNVIGVLLKEPKKEQMLRLDGVGLLRRTLALDVFACA